MIRLAWLTPQNNLGMRKVRPFVVRVKGVPLYLVLYPFDGKNPTGTALFGTERSFRETKAAQPAQSVSRKSQPDFRGLQLRRTERSEMDCGGLLGSLDAEARVFGRRVRVNYPRLVQYVEKLFMFGYWGSGRPRRRFSTFVKGHVR